MCPVPSTVPLKKKRGRPLGTKSKKKPFRDESGPLWAIVDQLTLIHDDLNEIVKLATAAEAPAGPSMFDEHVTSMFDQVKHG